MNPISLLGLLGLLGILGPVTGEYAYCGFFGFFVFFGYVLIPYDELFSSYVSSSAKYAFLSMVILFAAAVPAIVLFHLQTSAVLLLTLVFVISIIVFICRLRAYEFAEKKGV